MAFQVDPERIYAITRPEPGLLLLYFIRSLASLVFFPLVLLPLAVRYFTLRYSFDQDSIRKSHGLLFRHEDLVQYARIQDLHITRGLVQRWLGLATIEVQTAAGSTAAEMTLEGLSNYDEVRDFLYSKMRGARFGEHEPDAIPEGLPADDDVATLLTEIRDELRLLRGRQP